MSTLSKQVGQKILEQIKSGELKVGDRLQPEVSIATDLGVSRSTVRLAFAELEKSGVLSRKKRAGTRIIADEPQQHFSMATRGIQELLALGRDTHLDISGIRRVSVEKIPLLGQHAECSDQWLEITGTRTLPGEQRPFSVNQVYVPTQYSGIESELINNVTSVFQAIESAYGVTVARVTQATRAITCPANERKIMGLAKASPALRIDAVLYSADDNLIEVSQAIFDPERFQLDTEVKIEW